MELNPKYKTMTAAMLKKPFLKVCPKKEVKNPTPKNRGNVPKTKAPIIKAPSRGFPLEIAKASIAKVVPQGIKMVKIPKNSGANKSRLLDSFLTSLVKNLGGCKITYLKIGWIFNKFKATATMYNPARIWIIILALSESVSLDPNQPKANPKRM